MKAHETNTIHLERFFEIVEEKLLESGYIAKINNKNFILHKLSGAIYEILDKNLSKEINFCFNIYLGNYELFKAFFHNCNIGSFNSSYNIFSGHSGSDTEDSFIEIATLVSRNDIKHINSNVHEIKNIFRKHYISFYETPHYYYVSYISKFVNTAFHLDIEIKRMII